jgi:hypothetical protein
MHLNSSISRDQSSLPLHRMPMHQTREDKAEDELVVEAEVGDMPNHRTVQMRLVLSLRRDIQVDPMCARC